MDHAKEATNQEEAAQRLLNSADEWEQRIEDGYTSSVENGIANRCLMGAQVHASLAISHRLAVIARDMPAGLAPGGGPR